MRTIRDIFLLVIILFLMLLRIWFSGYWLGSVAIAGVLITWMDIICKIVQRNQSLSNAFRQRRFVIIVAVLVVVGLAMAVIMVWNLVVGLEWVNDSLLLDELGLLSLLLCLPEEGILKWITAIIQNGFSRRG